MLSRFQNDFAFCVHVGKYDFSFATEYCFVSHKSLDRENISEMLIYFYEICLHVIFKIILSFHRVHFPQSRFV